MDGATIGTYLLLTNRWIRDRQSIHLGNTARPSVELIDAPAPP
jgi:hypothetical protein